MRTKTLLSPVRHAAAIFAATFLLPRASAQGLPGLPGIPKPGIHPPDKAQLPNQLANGDLRGTIMKFVNYALTFVGLLGVIAILYAGFLYLTSFGSSDGPKKAKDAILYVVIGIVLVLLSWTIVNFIIDLPDDAGITGSGGDGDGGFGFPPR